MAIVLALATALLYGVADFSGGLATRRASVLQVVAGAHVIGGIGVVLASFLVAERFDGRDLALGAAGGAFGLIGVVLLYRRLAIGPMSVVAPLTAITAAVVPALWGLLQGERLTTTGWIGIGFGLLAVLLVSGSGDRPDAGAPVTTQVVVESLAAGAGFGIIFIFLDATSAETAPWPVAGARMLSCTVLVAFLVITARARPAVWSRPLEPSLLALIAVSGVGDTAANVTFLLATTSESGHLAVVSVLASLYPVSTVILARLLLGERMSRPQVLGFGAALGATVLLSVG